MNAQNHINIQRLSEAMDLVYKTIILDETSAEIRGEVIQALDRLIIAQGGNELSSQIESVPWSVRMRESGEHDLINYTQWVREQFEKDDE